MPLWVPPTSEAALSATFAPRVERLSIPATLLWPVYGTAPLGAVGNTYPAILLDDASNNAYAGGILGRGSGPLAIPDHWATYDVRAWVAPVADSGDAALFYTHRRVESGTSVISSSTTETTVVATVSSNVVSIITLATGLAVPTSGADLAFRVCRSGNATEDTLGADLALIKVEFLRAS